LFLVPLGFFTGVYSSLVGVGGGFVMVPVLLLLYPDISPDIVTAISLMVVFANATSGSAAYARMKRIDYKAGVLFAIATIPGSVVGARVTAFIPRETFELVFGLFMISISLLLFVNARKEKTSSGDIDVTAIPPYNPLVGIIASVCVGFLSSLFGIGGGVIHVPMMLYLLHFPAHIATATSQFILMISSLAGTTTHLFMGTLSGNFIKVLLLGVGIVFGAQVGARLSRRLQGAWLVRGLAVALGVAGLQFVVSALAWW
jgi:hypothetical protein